MLTAVDRASEYTSIRDLPGLDATTRLSPCLHFGTISARELEARLVRKRSDGAKALRRQLAWRDFWLSVIRSSPANRTEEYDQRFRGMRWRDDPESLDAWRQGETGRPLDRRRNAPATRRRMDAQPACEWQSPRT